MYLDDGLIWSASFESCRQSVAIIRRDLCLAGSDVSEEKCEWFPKQKLTWLGFEIDLEKFYVKPTAERLFKLRSILNTLRQCKAPTILQRQRMIGYLCSLSLTLGDVSTRLSRFTMMTIAESQANENDQNKRVAKTAGEADELESWTEAQLLGDSGKSLHVKSFVYDSVMFCDASEEGAGSVCVINGNKLVSFEDLDNSKGKSSTFRELHAVNFGLNCFSSVLANKRVLIKTDNTSAVSIINKGSMKRELHEWSRKIWQSAKVNNIQIKAKWVPRENNAEADAASREKDINDWSVSDKIKDNFGLNWKQPTCDFLPIIKTLNAINSFRLVLFRGVVE